MRRAAGLAALVAALAAAAPGAAMARVVIGSKAFPESWILGEAAATLARQAGAEAEHRRNLGNRRIGAAIERGNALVAVQEEPQHRQHALDCAMNRRRHRMAPFLERNPQRQQIDEQIDKLRRRPRQVTAIGKDLGIELLAEPLQRRHRQTFKPA